MKQTLEELVSVPGVQGGYVLHIKQGIGAHLLPVTVPRENLPEVSRQLLKIFSASRMNFKAIRDISLHYEGMVLYLRQVSELLFLVAICAPSVNTNVLSMSVSLAIEELDRQEKINAAQEKPAAAPVAVRVPASEDMVTAETIRASGPMAKSLDSVEEALSGVMGPMAEMIMEDAINEWLQTAKASFDTLPVLVRVLSREIGDAEKIASFHAALDQYGLK